MLAGARIRISALFPDSTAPALGLRDFSFVCAHTFSGNPVTTLELSSPSLCGAYSALSRPRPLSDSARPRPSDSRPAQGPDPRGSALPRCGTPPTGSGNASAVAGSWSWRHARVSGPGRCLRPVAVSRRRGLLVCRCRCHGVATR